MAGANYMGGRRNSARARTKDATGRAQKSHFMRQRYQILARGLRNHSLEDDKDCHPAKSARIKEIGFAHAKRDLEQHGPSTRPFVRMRASAPSLQSSSSPSSSRQSLLRNSKILEDLDINEPSGFRATLQRILRQPDLAGISRLTSGPVSPGHTKNSLENGRKPQGTGESTPTDTSSSFHYDSPTKKDVSGRPQMLTKKRLIQPSARPDEDQSYSDSNSLANSSSAHTSKSAIANDSFGSSLDRLSMMQEVGSSSSYPDSGFSELSFSDVGDKENPQSRPNFPLNLGVPMNPAEPSGHHSSKMSSGKGLEDRVPRTVFSSSSSRNATGGKVRSVAHESDRVPTRTSPHREDFGDWLSLTSVPAIQIDSESSAESPDYRENCRYGVGYVPSDPSAEYRPFVPLTIMLPSYSDEDSVDDEGTHGIEMGSLANLVAPMDVDPFVSMETKKIPFAASPTFEANDIDMCGFEGYSAEEEHTDRTHSGKKVYHNVEYAKSDVSPYRTSWSRTSGSAFQTPLPRFTTSPTRRLPSLHRARFTFPTEYSVSSVLSNTNSKEPSALNLPGTSSKNSGSTIFSASPWSFPSTPRPGSDKLIMNGSLHGTNDSLRFDLARSSNAPVVQKTLPTNSAPVTPFSNTAGSNLATPPISNSGQKATPSPQSAEPAVSMSGAFDGPDLFAGDDGEDNE